MSTYHWNYQTFHLLAVSQHFCAPSWEELLVSSNFYMDSCVVLHGDAFDHDFSMHADSQDLES